MKREMKSTQMERRRKILQKTEGLEMENGGIPRVECPLEWIFVGRRSEGIILICESWKGVVLMMGIKMQINSGSPVPHRKEPRFEITGSSFLLL